MKRFCFVSFLLSTILFGAVSAQANRITAANVIRCQASQVTPAMCEQQRLYARSSGCVTADEYNSLVANAGMPSCMYGSNAFVGWCTCGCFEENTLLKLDATTLSRDGNTVKSVATAFANGARGEIAHLSSAATLGSLDFKNSPVRNVSIGEEKLPLVVIEAEGGAISLSTNHPTVLANGAIVRAEKLKAGDALLGYDGKARKILSIERRPTKAKVYNVSVDSTQDGEHILIANGFLMGDLYLQGSLHYFENQLLIRQ